MEETKLQQALDEILKKCKDAGHKLHVFKQEDVELESVIGRGEEGIVQLCRIKYHGLEEPAAMKTITSNGDKEMLEFLLKELEMVVLGTDTIVNTVLKVYGVTLIPINLNTRSQNVAHCHLGIIMERGICNLLELCLREQMSLAMRIRVMTQLARALHYLHTGDPHILHRDIKPQNFVVVEAEISERTGILRNVKLKVIDLGMAVVVPCLEEAITGVVGTWGFHAPEMWEEKPYDARADIFSLAITFLIMLIEKPTTKLVDDVLDNLHSMKVEGILGENLIEAVKYHFIKEVIPTPLEDLLKKMLSCDTKRPANIGIIYKQLHCISEKQRHPSTSSSSSSLPLCTWKSDGSGRGSDSDYSSQHSNSSRGSGRDDSSAASDPFPPSMSTGVSSSMSTGMPGSLCTGMSPPPFLPNSPMSPPLFIHPSTSQSMMHPLSILAPSSSSSSWPSFPPPSPPSPPSLPSPPAPGYVTLEEFNNLAERLKEQSMTLSFKESMLKQKEQMLQQQRKVVEMMETNNRMLLKKLSISKTKDGPMKYGVRRLLFRQPRQSAAAPDTNSQQQQQQQLPPATNSHPANEECKRTRSTSESSSPDVAPEFLPTRKRRKTSPSEAMVSADADANPDAKTDKRAMRSKDVTQKDASKDAEKDRQKNAQQGAVERKGSEEKRTRFQRHSDDAKRSTRDHSTKRTVTTTTTKTTTTKTTIETTTSALSSSSSSSAKTTSPDRNPGRPKRGSRKSETVVFENALKKRSRNNDIDDDVTEKETIAMEVNEAATPRGLRSSAAAFSIPCSIGSSSEDSGPSDTKSAGVAKKEALRRSSSSPTSSTASPPPSSAAPTPLPVAPNPSSASPTPSSTSPTPSSASPTPSSAAMTFSTGRRSSIPEKGRESKSGSRISSAATTSSTEASTPPSTAPPPSSAASIPSSASLSPSSTSPTPSSSSLAASSVAPTPSSASPTTCTAATTFSTRSRSSISDKARESKSESTSGSRIPTDRLQKMKMALRNLETKDQSSSGVKGQVSGKHPGPSRRAALASSSSFAQPSYSSSSPSSSARPTSSSSTRPPFSFQSSSKNSSSASSSSSSSPTSSPSPISSIASATSQTDSRAAHHSTFRQPAAAATQSINPTNVSSTPTPSTSTSTTPRTSSTSSKSVVKEEEEEESFQGIRITTRNQKSFWSEKVTRSRLHDRDSLKGVWNSSLTSISNWFGK